MKLCALPWIAYLSLGKIAQSLFPICIMGIISCAVITNICKGMYTENSEMLLLWLCIISQVIISNGRCQLFHWLFGLTINANSFINFGVVILGFHQKTERGLDMNFLSNNWSDISGIIQEWFWHWYYWKTQCCVSPLASYKVSCISTAVQSFFGIVVSSLLLSFQVPRLASSVSGRTYRIQKCVCLTPNTNYTHKWLSSPYDL